jgi:hypothetical protein
VAPANGPRQRATLPVHVEPEVRQLFEASVLIQVGNGAKTLFWTDCWLDEEAVVDMALVLASLVDPRIKKDAHCATGPIQSCMGVGH